MGCWLFFYIKIKMSLLSGHFLYSNLIALGSVAVYQVFFVFVVFCFVFFTVLKGQFSGIPWPPALIIACYTIYPLYWKSLWSKSVCKFNAFRAEFVFL